MKKIIYKAHCKNRAFSKNIHNIYLLSRKKISNLPNFLKKRVKYRFLVPNLDPIYFKFVYNTKFWPLFTNNKRLVRILFRLHLMNVRRKYKYYLCPITRQWEQKKQVIEEYEKIETSCVKCGIKMYASLHINVANDKLGFHNVHCNKCRNKKHYITDNNYKQMISTRLFELTNVYKQKKEKDLRELMIYMKKVRMKE